jgi:hypothetical protein
MPGNLSGNPISVTPNSNTIFTVTGDDNEGCYGTEEVTVTVPNITVTNNVVIPCDETTATLEVTGAPSGSTYSWNSGTPPPLTGNPVIVQPSVSTLYTVTINYAGCPAFDLISNVTVATVPPKPELLEYVNNICGDPYTELHYEIVNPGMATYSFSINPSASYTSYADNGTYIDVLWDHSYVPPSPPLFATITVTATENDCISVSEFKIFECCKLKPGSENGAIDLTNTNAVTESLNSSYTGSRFIINGNFHINQTLSVGSGCEFFMGPEAAIIVDPGNAFHISETSLHQQCNYMWKGIVVNDYTSNVAIDNVSSISDAYTGVDANNNSGLSITGSQFYNNLVSVKLNEYINPSNSPEIFGNTFSSSSVNGNIYFFPPYDIPYNMPFAGIVINHCNNITIGKEDLQNKNKFISMFGGIRSKNSIINVINNEFSDIKKCFGGSCPNPYPINFGPLGAGIYSMRTTTYIPSGFTGQGITIGGDDTEKNYFYTNDYGVHLYNNRQFLVKNNKFSLNNIGIFASELSTSGFLSKIIDGNEFYYVNYCGIQLKSISNCQLKYNYINDIAFIPTSDPADRHYAIYTEGSELINIYGNIVQNSNSTTDVRIEGICTNGGHHNVNCNHITNVGKALAFYGNLNPTSVRLNTMNNCVRGIYLNHGSIGIQGSTGHPSDNSWLNNFTYHTMTEDNATVLGLPIIVRNTFGIYHPNSMINFWLGSDPFSINTTSGTGGFCIFPPQEMDPLIFAHNKEMEPIITADAIDYAEYHESNEWMSKFNLFNSYYHENTDSLDQDMQLFLYDYSPDNKHLVDIKEMIDTNAFLNAYELSQFTSPQSPPAEILLNIYKVVIDAANRVNNVTDDILFYEDEVDILREIAGLCPYEYGKGVYLARLLLSRIESTVYFNSCEDMIERRNFEKPKDDASLEVLVYPNPAQNEFIVELIGDINDQEALLELYDIFGKKVKRVILTNEPLKTINISELSAGLYFYKLGINNNIIRQDKIIVIK